ncbi:MAG: hypothetical protein Q9192_003449 [Flavoplaca navasiana]
MTFDFLGLPGELRNKIYRYALIPWHQELWIYPKQRPRIHLHERAPLQLPDIDPSESEEADQEWDRHVADWPEGWHNPFDMNGTLGDTITIPIEQHFTAILQVSKQINEEAYSIFMQEVLFYTSNLTLAKDVLEAIQPRGRDMIRRVELVWEGDGATSVFKTLARCQNLTELHLHVRHHSTKRMRSNGIPPELRDLTQHPAINIIRGMTQLRRVQVDGESHALERLRDILNR